MAELISTSAADTTYTDKMIKRIFIREDCISPWQPPITKDFIIEFLQEKLIKQLAQNRYLIKMNLSTFGGRFVQQKPNLKH